MFIKILMAIVAGYFLGSIPTAYLVCKKKTGEDIRTLGSGNVGGTNTLRVLGKGPGFVVIGVDVLKGLIAALIGLQLAGTWGGLLAGIFVVLGHVFPVWLNFSGGKGAACTLGVMIILMPMMSLIIFVFWGIVLLATGYVSLATMLAALSAIITSVLLNYPAAYSWVILILAIVIFIMHRPNIQRLRTGREHRVDIFNLKHKKNDKT